MNELLDVVVVQLSDGRVYSVIGYDLNERQAERREMTGLSRYDTDKVFIASVPAGSHQAGDKYRSLP